MVFKVGQFFGAVNYVQADLCFCCSVFTNGWNAFPHDAAHSLTLCQLVSCDDNLCKQFGPRSGLTWCRAWSGSELFDSLMVFLKEFFEKVDFEKNQQTTKKKKKNYPACKELPRRLISKLSSRFLPPLRCQLKHILKLADTEINDGSPEALLWLDKTTNWSPW